MSDATFNKIQINASEETNDQGRVVRKTMLLNIRSDSVIESIRLFNQLKAKLAEPAEENMIIPDNGRLLLEQIKYEKTDEPDEKKCPTCNSRLVERRGKNGPFLGCSGFISKGCRYTKQLQNVFN